MAQIHVTRPAPFGALTVARTIAAFERGLESYRGWRQAARTAQDLHALSDRQLDDIGLFRGEIETVASRLSGR
ncbi:MAG: DUF1127 domain-containing protein [Pseudomonadota bacterium]